MIRKTKVLGLAFVAILALAAVAASTASAQQGTFTAEGGSATGIGTETGEKANKLSAFGANVECPGSTYTVHKVGSTTETVVSGATTFTVSPHYKACTGPFGWPGTVSMNGCDYVAHLGETTGGVAGTYGLTFDVDCPVGKVVELTLWTSAAEEGGATKACVQTFGDEHGGKAVNQGLKGAHLTDLGNGFLALTGVVEGVHATKLSQGHGILCPSATTAEAKLELDVTLEGTNDGTTPPAGSGVLRKVSLSHP